MGPSRNSVTKIHFCQKTVKLGSHLSNECLKCLNLTAITNMLFKRIDCVFQQDLAPAVYKAKNNTKIV